MGLLLWKIRQVFSAFEREYQLLVGDDGSTDATGEILQPYTRALPLTVIRSPEQRGYARTVESLLRLAVERTDRPKRDCAIMMHADFAHEPHFIPDMVRHIDAGPTWWLVKVARWVNRHADSVCSGAGRRCCCGAGWECPGVSDIVSGLRRFPAHHPAQCAPRCTRPDAAHGRLGRERGDHRAGSASRAPDRDGADGGAARPPAPGQPARSVGDRASAVALARFAAFHATGRAAGRHSAEREVELVS